MLSMIYLLALIPLGILAAVILSRWRLGIVLIFIWLLFEDVIRRLIPGQPAQVMLFKDVLIFLTYVSFLAVFMTKSKKIWKPAFGGVLLLLTVFLTINALNPNSPGLLFGLIGLRSYLWYLPLMFLGYYMFTPLETSISDGKTSDKSTIDGNLFLTGFDSQEKLLKFCQILAYLSIPLFLFAVFQYFFYDSGWVLVRSLADATQAHSFGVVVGNFKGGDIPFLPSVFGTGHRYSRFSMLLFFLGLGLLMTKYPANSRFKKNKKLLLASVFSSFLGIMISGARTAFVLTSMGSVLFFLFVRYAGNVPIRYLWRNGRVWLFSMITIILLVLPASFLFGNSAFYQISGFYAAFKERIPWVFEGFWNALLNAKFFGMGTGTLSQGWGNIPGGAEWFARNKELITTGFRFETGFGKIIFELGVFGAIIFYLFWKYLFYLMIKEIKLLKNYNLRNLGLGIFIFSFLILFWFTFVHSQVLGDATTLVILWFFLGVFFSLNKATKYESVRKYENDFVIRREIHE